MFQECLTSSFHGEVIAFVFLIKFCVLPVYLVCSCYKILSPLLSIKDKSIS